MKRANVLTSDPTDDVVRLSDPTDDILQARPNTRSSRISSSEGNSSTTAVAPASIAVELLDESRAQRFPIALALTEWSSHFNPEFEEESASNLQLLKAAMKFKSAATELSGLRSDLDQQSALSALPSATVASAREAIRSLRESATGKPSAAIERVELALLGILIHQMKAPVRAMAAEALLQMHSDSAKKVLRSRAPFEHNKMVSALIAVGLAESRSR